MNARRLQAGLRLFRIAVVSLLLGLAGAAVVLGQTHDGGGAPGTPQPTSANDQIEQLLEEHGCWTGPAPADMQGKVPGHVVVTMPSGRVVYGGPRLVDQALGQVFDGEKHGLMVAGFCR